MKAKRWMKAAAFAMAMLPAAAVAHPHVFADARLDLIVDESSAFSALRHLWRFDDGFTATVLMEFDEDGDLELSVSELETVAGVVHDSLAEFNYFQFVTADGKDVAMQAPERLVADMHDGQLIILFESKPEAPVPMAGDLAFGVYDPTFFTAIDFVEDEMMAVENLPAFCTRTVVRPDPDEAIEQNQGSLQEDFFEGSNDLGKIFATRLEVKCAKP